MREITRHRATTMNTQKQEQSQKRDREKREKKTKETAEIQMRGGGGWKERKEKGIMKNIT